jgi:hypothetical protein
LTVRMEAGRKGGKTLKTCYLPLRP